MRFKSAALHGFGGELTRVFARALFLAAEAWTSVSAIVLALWRMGVSHRRLLQWQTAEQSERRSADLAGTFAAMWPVVYFSGLLLAFSQTFAGRAAAICWIFTPLIAHRLKREKKEKPLDGGEREFLLRRAAEIWRYFRENCTAASHHLPPDNVQLSPPASGADRTSPTNIAMALAGALSALELGIASETEALTLCGNILDTVGVCPSGKAIFITGTIRKRSRRSIRRMFRPWTAAIWPPRSPPAPRALPRTARPLSQSRRERPPRRWTFARSTMKNGGYSASAFCRRERSGAELVRSFRERRAPDGVFHHRLRADRAPPLAAAQPRAGGLSETARHGKLVGQPF